MADRAAPTQAPQGQGVNIDLDRLIARYGRVIANAQLDAEVATQRAERAEEAVRVLAQRVAALEADAEADEIVDELDLADTTDETQEDAA